MKKIFLISIFIFLNCYNSFSQYNPENADKLIIGKWTGIDSNGLKNTMILEEENFVTFETAHKSYGREFEMNGGNYVYKYIINSKESPIKIDFIIYQKETNTEEKHFKSIIRFLDENTIEMRSCNNPSKYPKKFARKKDSQTIILKRVEK